MLRRWLHGLMLSSAGIRDRCQELSRQPCHHVLLLEDQVGPLLPIAVDVAGDTAKGGPVVVVAREQPVDNFMNQLQPEF
jgi:hypothetical protein